MNDLRTQFLFVVRFSSEDDYANHSQNVYTFVTKNRRKLRFTNAVADLKFLMALIPRDYPRISQYQQKFGKNV